MDRKAITVRAATLVAFAFLVTACGGEEPVNPNPTADTGYDVGSDVIGGDAGFDGGSDAAPDATPDVPPSPTFTYEELCSECADRGNECPPEVQFLSWQQALTVAEAAEDLCVDPEVDPCEDFYDIADYVWSCDGFDVGPSGDTFEARPAGNRCEVWWAGDWTSSGPGALKFGGIIGYEPDGSREFRWLYHGPGSMSSVIPRHSIESPCTGTPNG